MYKKGFTLIELLVVIAIIGILSGVVLTSLNTARGKASDAAVKANLANIRAQAELYYDSNGGYGDTSGDNCAAASTMFTDPTVTQQINAAVQQGNGSAVCVANGNNWAASVPLKSGGSWCVDSSGAAKAAAADTTTVSCQ